MRGRDYVKYKRSQKSPAADRPEPAPRAAPTPKASATKETVAYFDSSRGQFWTKNSRGEWIQFSEAALRRVLKYQHYQDITDKEAQYAVIDRHFIELQHVQDVAYAGSIAGYKTGLHEICGQRVLVTSGPRLLRPQEGDWKTLRDFVGQLLGDDVRYFYAWAKSALKTLYKGAPFRPGQMLAIAGPAGCGKSLLQNLITEMVGGRSAKPYRYMTGETAFNGDLLCNEHLMIEDEAGGLDLRVRRHFGSQLKNMIVNQVQSMHRKGRDALSVTPFWRLTISLNDEPENLAVLPPLDDSLRDKLILMRAYAFVPPHSPDDLAGRDRWRRALSAELPAFLRYLQTYHIPPKMLNVRYGCVAHQDPELLHELHALSPESELLELIDMLQIWGIDREPWEGTASDLKQALLAKDRHNLVQKLLAYSSVTGRYLAQLSAKFPERVTVKKRTEQGKIWQINLPSK